MWIDQKNCMYQPHVVALMTNQQFEVKNQDSIVHNIHVAPRENPKWNESEDVGAPAIEESLRTEEMAIPIMCNIHPWMRALAFVFDNPYFATTSRDGKFELKNVPPGKYMIEAWQEKYGALDQEITVAPKQVQSASFRFKSTS